MCYGRSGSTTASTGNEDGTIRQQGCGMAIAIRDDWRGRGGERRCSRIEYFALEAAVTAVQQHAAVGQPRRGVLNSLRKQIEGWCKGAGDRIVELR